MLTAGGTGGLRCVDVVRKHVGAAVFLREVFEPIQNLRDPVDCASLEVTGTSPLTALSVLAR